jgi:hypothetical protein
MVCVLLNLKSGSIVVLITIIIATTLIVIIQSKVKFYIEATPVPRNHMEHLGAVVIM